MGGARRVYILDEAHMLSSAAWNAFLKTLEEPPPHVVFVLATTEEHKVPATIVDRCHSFHFHRPSLEQIAGVLRKVADDEQIELPAPAAGMIARSATGSFRDALGTLEQLVTYGGKQVELDDVLDILGVADAELVLDAAEALVEREPKGALLAVQRLAESGRDYTQFMRDLSAHLRHLLVVSVTGEVPDTFSVTAEHPERLRSQAERMAQGEIVRAIEFLASAIAAVKDGSDPRVQLEVALLKSTQPQADLSLQALMLRVEGIEGRIGGTVAPAEDGGGEQPPPRQPRTAEAGARATGPSVAAQAVAVHEDAPEAAAAPAADLERIQALWPAVTDAVREGNAMVGTILTGARPTALEASRLTLAFPEDAAFAKKRVETHRELVQSALRGVTGSMLTVAFELSGTREEPVSEELGHDELIERLRAELGATEVFEDEED
jgi:DNA polymerase-3 subunit gamma/tau